MTRAFFSLMGIPNGACSGVFMGKTPMDVESPHFTYEKMLYCGSLPGACPWTTRSLSTLKAPGAEFACMKAIVESL